MMVREWEMMAEFGRRLGAWLGANHVSQRQLAEALGVSDAAVSAWVLGERMPNASSVRRISLYTNVSADWWLCLERRKRGGD